MTDLIVVGGGPAGLTAALYARRAGKSVLVLEKETFGGQITFSPKVENIPGHLTLSGNEFAEKLVEQVIEQGAETDCCEVLGVQKTADGFLVKTDAGEKEARAVILATGARHRLLGLPGEENLVGNGISFCAVCDGAFYTNKDVVLIGGGNSALQEAVLLCDLVKSLVIVQDLPYLTGEKKLQETLAEKKNVTVICGAKVLSYLGESEVEGVRIRTDEGEREIRADGVFLAIGLVPQNDPFTNLVKLDERGYVDAAEDTLTGTPGIFTAGDCRKKRIRQVTTAAADGAVAALSACDYLDKRER